MSARTVRRAGAIGLAATGLGLLAQLLFFDTGLGLNFPVAITALLVASWFVPDRASRWPPLVDAWLPAVAIVLAAFVALRGDTTLVALDMLGSVTLTVLSIASFGGLAVMRRPFLAIVGLGLQVTVSAFGSAADVLEGIHHQLPVARMRTGLAPMSGVLRGLLLAVPLMLLFIVLFSSADAVFSRLLSDLPDLEMELGSVPGRTAVALAAAWAAAGLLAFVGHGGEREAIGLATREHRWLGTTEAVTLLVALDLLFGIFVAVQTTYLFGGRDTLEASGLTYADYARRGFFELLAVAMVVGALVLALEVFVRRRSRAYLAGSLVLIGLTLVVLASAFLRLRLYQEAYGWTELRFYVMAAIVWLAIGAVGAIACVALDRTRWLPHGLVVLSVVFGLAFNVIGPVRFIAEQNTARASDPTLPSDASSDLDVYYLALLGDDALVVLAERYPDGLPPSARIDVAQVLDARGDLLATDASADDWQAWNLARQRLMALLPRGSLLR